MSGDGVQQTTVDVGEYKVNVATAGKSSGPVLVMLHGAGQRDDWRAWQGMLSLADEFKLVMPDLIGFGRSSRPEETPDYKEQARVMRELLDVLGVAKVRLAGFSWGGQVALELAMDDPERVECIVLVSSAYDKAQLPRLEKLRRPTLIIWAEDDMIAQLKAGYLLRDAIATSRLEVLEPVAKNPSKDFTIAHRLLESRGEEVLARIARFLAAPTGSIAEPPELEAELRGMALGGRPKEKPGEAGAETGTKK